MSSANAILSKLNTGRPSLSVEFFPPKTEEGARAILKTASGIRN